MADRNSTVYTRKPLNEFSLKERILIRAADVMFYALIKLIGMTLRCDLEGDEHRRSITDAHKVPIYAVWHDRIFGGTYFLRDEGIVVLTSKSLDGEYIARFLTRFGFGAIRGSSSRGGVRGLVEMIRHMKKGVPMAFTVDGPRGPRYVAKSGAIILAKKTGNPILPLAVEYKSAWKLKSWDRLQIPRPFSRAHLTFAEPIYVGRDSDEAEKLNELQEALERLTENGERWRIAKASRVSELQDKS